MLELTTAVAGPVACAVLGDMGADVIKVENPRGRTAAHTAAPPPKEGAPVTSAGEWSSPTKDASWRSA